MGSKLTDSHIMFTIFNIAVKNREGLNFLKCAVCKEIRTGRGCGWLLVEAMGTEVAKVMVNEITFLG